MKITSILCVLSFWLLIPCHAQEGKMFTTDKELSSSMINKIYQDRDGVVWIATEDGLNRYDGAKFTVYRNNKNNPHTLLNNFVRSILQDSKGHLFVGNLNGMQIHDRATDQFFTIPMKLVDGKPIEPNVGSIIERKNGELMIGTAGHSLFVLKNEGDSIRARQLNQLVPSNLITCLFEDSKENLWVATGDNGIFRICQNGNLVHYPHKNNIAFNNITSICESKQGQLYVGGLKIGLFQYNAQTDSFGCVSDNHGAKLPVKVLYPSDTNNIYIGTDGEGLKLYDIEEKKIKEANFNTAAFNLQNAKIHSVLKDKMGNIWLGFFQKGVMIIPAISNDFKYIGYKSTMHNIIGSSCVMSVFKDHSGVIWVAADNDGIYGINPDGTLKVHFAPTSSPHSVPATIMGIFEDSNHNLWVGSYLNGMARLNTTTGHCEYIDLTSQNTSAAESVYCFAEDNQKNLWVGTMGSGLYKIDIDTKDVSSYISTSDGSDWTKINNLHNAWINCLLHTSDDRLYIGTYDGLGCLDIKNMDFVSPLNNRRILYGDVVYALCEDLDKCIWVGTSKGLKYLNPKTNETREYTQEDGLPSNFICGIKVDQNGFLWISTNSGLSRFDAKNNSFINFYASDGLQGNEFSKGAACAGPEGEFIFGGTNGITHFDPTRISNPNKQPEIRITDFYIHDTTVKKGMKSGGKEIVDTAVMDADHFYLSHNDNSFSIEFSAMEFYSPERITYMYAFNNDNWISLRPGINRISFSSLTPGTYHFKVRAQDYASLSNVKSITITISPAWYASAWARIIYLLIASGIITIIAVQIRHRIRTNKEIVEHKHTEQINEAKLQFFINISHEIRTPMSLVISPLQKLMAMDKDGERQKSYFTIYRNAERIVRLVNQLMDVRKIDKSQMHLKFQETEIVSFVSDLCSTFDDQAHSKNISLNFNTEVEEQNIWVDLKHFDKIIINLISNAFKFTPDNGEINISLRTGSNEDAPTPLQHYLEIVVEDTGIGISPEDMERIFERFYQIDNSHNNSNTGTGIGLHLCRSLVELHHGTIKARNNEGKSGSHFIITLPLGNNHLKPEDMEEKEHTNTLVQTPPRHGPAQQESDGKSDKVRSKTKTRVLVVEDDEEIRRYICQELASDFHTLECTNGKEALSIVLKKTPDLVISDIMMPEMDGLTLCKKMKQNVIINHIPVILLTAKSREEDNIEGLETGADAYIVKPFNIELLRKTVFNLIKSREMLRNNFSGNQIQEDKLQKLNVQSPDDKLLSKVMKVINDNLSNPNLNVEMIATEVGISRVHLHRKLKELTNQSTRDLIRNVRLKQAASLLADKHHNITEVASLTGFTNIAYFSTAFKELFGVPPTVYMEGKLNTTGVEQETEQ